MKSKAPSSYTRADFKGFKKHLEERGNSPRTVGKKIGFLSTILSCAIQDEKLTANPATGLLKAATGATRKTSIPYSAQDVQNILGSKIYVSSARPAAGGGEAVAWLPLLGLLTGGRLEELVQLRVDDDGFVDGLGYYVNITDCDDEQHVKTDESRRRMPVHPDLLKAGFMRYVRRLQDAGETRLFPKRRRTARAAGQATGPSSGAAMRARKWASSTGARSSNPSATSSRTCSAKPSAGMKSAMS
jgi:integrase